MRQGCGPSRGGRAQNAVGLLALLISGGRGPRNSYRPTRQRELLQTTESALEPSRRELPGPPARKLERSGRRGEISREGQERVMRKKEQEPTGECGASEPHSRLGRSPSTTPTNQPPICSWCKGLVCTRGKTFDDVRGRTRYARSSRRSERGSYLSEVRSRLGSNLHSAAVRNQRTGRISMGLIREETREDQRGQRLGWAWTECKGRVFSTTTGNPRKSDGGRGRATW